mgnify:FL=1
MKKLFASFALTALFSASAATAGNTSQTEKDSVATVAADTTVRKKGFINKVLAYFNDANKTDYSKKFDFSIIGGPHYSTDTKLGLGLVAAGLYKTDRNDTILPPSNMSLFGDVSTVGFYMLGVRGLHIFPHDRYRLDYTLYFYSFPCKYWGIGYANGNNDANETEMNRWQAQAKASFMFRVAPSTYIGPMLTFDFIEGKDIKNPELLEGMDRITRNTGVGLTFVYDSRDVTTNPKRGFYVNLSQCFRPKFMGNDYAFSTTDLRFNAYRRVWKGGIIATDLRSQLNFGNPSWGMMALLGNSYSMRGYYEGRYRDKHKIEAQVELRQHVWKRNSVVAWVGAGTVFNKFSSMRMGHVLPNFGIGYRWEFKKDVNVRLDYGFGKSGQSGFIFNINEAF